jgi:hypothetical protein
MTVLPFGLWDAVVDWNCLIIDTLGLTRTLWGLGCDPNNPLLAGYNPDPDPN